MKLERINENREMFFQTKQPKTEEQQKFEIIEKLSEHWNKALKQEYLVPRSLYNYTIEELKQIENHYLNESSDMEEEDLKLVNNAIDSYMSMKEKGDNEKIYFAEDVLLAIGERNTEKNIEKVLSYFGINDPNFDLVYTTNNIDDLYNVMFESASNTLTDKELITETLQELRNLHLTNEAVEDIRIDGKEIVFDIKCDTELTGTNEYNGIDLRYNKICSIDESVKVKSFDVFDIDEEEEAKILEESSKMVSQIFRINELSFYGDNYKDFKNKVDEYKYQFLINIDDEIYYLSKGKEIFNESGFVAKNEKTGKLNIFDYNDINYIIVDGQKYNFDIKSNENNNTIY